ncbi:T9SS type A sorting domain-containing protein [Aureivirga marina]|uniref:T9SS type A sorting domain-containing protein n=1 Tax=Aureivirga marina TaxID=1182451 RepID=UPI0018CADE4C|nr:Omp28-related outer membrane protein [Aureivirga marina]
MIKKITTLFAFSLMLSQAADAQQIWSDDFESGMGNWTLTDSDGDSNNWEEFTLQTANATLGSKLASSYSWNDAVLTPDNLMTSEAIDLSTASATGLVLKFNYLALNQNYFAETFSVYVSTSSDPATILAGDALFVKTVAAGGLIYTGGVDISDFAGESTVYVSFRHHDSTDVHVLGIDNVGIENLDNTLDAELAEVSFEKYIEQNTDTELRYAIVNNGSSNIETVELKWTDDNGENTQTITLDNPIAPFDFGTVAHPTMLNVAGVAESDIDFEISAVNGGTDEDTTNNSISNKYHTISEKIARPVIVEEGTGTWCGWCPRGAVAMDYMTETYPDQFIGIAVHNNDPMTVDEYDSNADFSGYPSMNVNRRFLGEGVSQPAMEQAYNLLKDLLAVADVQAETSFVENGEVTISVSATFKTVVSEHNFRLGVIVTEDNVTGTGSGYNQANYYAGGGNGDMGGYESLADPVPAADMVYDHVGRALLGGYNGQEGSIAADAVTDGNTITYDFTYSVPDGSDIQKMHVIPVIIDNDSGEFLGGTQIYLDRWLDTEEVAIDNSKFNIFPNPVSDKLTVSFEAKGNYKVQIFDMLGKVVLSKDYNNLKGAQNIEIPVSGIEKGNYMINVASEKGSYNKTIVIK